MKCIILAAGRGTRMKELTEKIPKPMLAYGNKNLLEHKLEALPEAVSEIIFVIGYLGKKIKDYFGNSWNGKNIHYVCQKEMLGTAHAIWSAQEFLNSPFIVLMGDDLYKKEDLSRLVNHYKKNKEWGVLVEKPKPNEKGGKVIVDKNGNLKNIVEDKNGNIDGFIYTGACLLTPEIFDYEMIKLHGVNEYGLPQTFCQAVADRPIKIHHASFWKRITAPEDLE